MLRRSPRLEASKNAGHESVDEDREGDHRAAELKSSADKILRQLKASGVELSVLDQARFICNFTGDLDSFGEVEEAIAGKQKPGRFAQERTNMFSSAQYQLGACYLVDEWKSSFPNPQRHPGAAGIRRRRAYLGETGPVHPGEIRLLGAQGRGAPGGPAREVRPSQSLDMAHPR